MPRPAILGLMRRRSYNYNYNYIVVVDFEVCVGLARVALFDGASEASVSSVGADITLCEILLLD